MKKVIMASGNKGKIKEAKEILNEYEVVSMKDLGIDIDVEEDKDTFVGNAEKKAFEIAKNLDGEIVISDDSGIEIDVLDGFPGVRTKRWHVGSDRERNLAIIEKLQGVPKEKRRIRWTTAIAVSDGKKTVSVLAYTDGYVPEEPRGENSFGFDEIFELEDGRTFAEISSAEKNEISARRKALELLREELNKF